MLSLMPGHASGTDRPTARPSTPPGSLRRRLFGDRSTAFLLVMGAGLVASVPLYTRQGIEWEPLTRSLAIFAGGPLSSSPDARIRAIAVAPIVAWLSVVAGVPWPCGVGFGLVAMLLYVLHEQATQQLDAQARIQPRPALVPLVRRLAVMKIGTALALAPAVATVTVHLLSGLGVSAETVLVMLMAGGAASAYFVYRHVRQFDESVVGRQTASC